MNKYVERDLKRMLDLPDNAVLPEAVTKTHAYMEQCRRRVNDARTTFTSAQLGQMLVTLFHGGTLKPGDVAAAKATAEQEDKEADAEEASPFQKAAEGKNAAKGGPETQAAAAESAASE